MTLTRQHKLFLNICSLLASQSHCQAVKVGAVLTKDGRVISTGYNGTPPGYDNCDEFFSTNVDRTKHHEFSTRYEIHAELNCLLYAAKQGISTNEATLYTIIKPCHQCAKDLVMAGIKEVVYLQPYDREANSTETDEFLARCNVALTHYTEPDSIGSS